MTDLRSIQASPVNRLNLLLAFFVLKDIHMVDRETAVAPINHDIAIGCAIEELAGSGWIATVEVHLWAIMAVGFEDLFASKVFGVGGADPWLLVAFARTGNEGVVAEGGRIGRIGEGGGGQDEGGGEESREMHVLVKGWYFLG